jgi:hypothetical protein
MHFFSVNSDFFENNLSHPNWSSRSPNQYSKLNWAKNIQENRRYVARKMAKNWSIGQKQAKMGRNSNFAGAVAHY